jgi:hypothetical protein
MGREIRPEGVASDEEEEEEEARGEADATMHAVQLAQLRALGNAALGHAEGGSALEARLAELMSGELGGGGEGEEEEECAPRAAAVACAATQKRSRA